MEFPTQIFDLRRRRRLAVVVVVGGAVLVLCWVGGVRGFGRQQSDSVVGVDNPFVSLDVVSRVRNASLSPISRRRIISRSGLSCLPVRLLRIDDDDGFAGNSLIE